MSEHSDEKWRPIPDWEDAYEVSSLGRVRSVSRQVVGADGRVYPVVGKVRALVEGRRGAKRVPLYRNDKITIYSVHRLVMAAFVGPCPEGMEVCHNNGDAGDNRLVNLRYDTRSANHLDKRAHGTARWGVDNPRARLSEQDVRDIRAAYGAGESQGRLAARFDTPQTNVSNIVRRKTWRHLP